MSAAARDLQEQLLEDYLRAAREELWKVNSALGRDSRASTLLRDVIPKLVMEIRRLSLASAVVTVTPPELPKEPPTPTVVDAAGVYPRFDGGIR